MRIIIIIFPPLIPLIIFFKHWLCRYVTFLQSADTSPFFPLCEKEFLLACSDTSHQLLRTSVWANLVDTNTAPLLFTLSTVPELVLHHYECVHWRQGDWCRRIMRPVRQGVRCDACARTLISSVSLTHPACPSVSGDVAISVWLWVYFVIMFLCVYFHYHIKVSTVPSGWSLRISFQQDLLIYCCGCQDVCVSLDAWRGTCLSLTAYVCVCINVPVIGTASA